MRILLSITICLLVALPTPAAARAYEKWLMRTDADVAAWTYAGLGEGEMTPDGLQFAVEGEAALYRLLPDGFHRYVDAVVIHLSHASITSATLIFMEVDDATEQILRAEEIPISLNSNGVTDAYVSLYPHRSAIQGMNTIALRLDGEAASVTFDGMRFIYHSLLEKVVGGVRSFFTLEPLGMTR